MLVFKLTVVTSALSLALLNSSAMAASPNILEHRDNGALVPQLSNTQNPVLQDIYQRYPDLLSDSSNNHSQIDFERAISDALMKLNESTTANRGGRDIHGGYEPGGGNKSDEFDMCRFYAGEARSENDNVIYWDGLSLDWTGTRPMIEGTDGYDIIFGTSLDDLIIGYGSGDVICGGPGQDLIFGDGYEFNSQNPDDGEDLLFGGANDDVIYGGGRVDFIVGDAGHDTLLGGNHRDWLIGETDDTIDLFSGDDFLVGMGDSAAYTGAKGNDVVNDVSFSNFSLDIPTFNMGAGVDTCYVIEKFKENADSSGCENVFVMQ